MAKKFRDLRQSMNPDAQVHSHKKAVTTKAELPLAELRLTRRTTGLRTGDKTACCSKNREEG